MSTLWHKVWFDLWHNKTRTLLAVISIASGVFAIGGIFGLQDQLLSSMDRAHQAVAPSHINMILRSYVDQGVVDDLRATPGVLDIDPVNQISVRYRLKPDEEWKLGTLVERPDYTAQTYDLMALREGAWPAGGKIAVERITGEYWGVKIGDRVTFEINGEARELEVGGIVRHPFVQPPPFGGQAHFFTDASGLAEFGIPEGRFGQLLVRVEAPYSLEKAQDTAGELRSRLGKLGYGVVVTLYQDPERHWGRQFVEGINLVLRIMAVMSLFLSVVLVLNTLMALITQQTDQIGVIKAVGGQSGTIFTVYLAGVLILGLAALLIALPGGMLFAFGMARWYLGLFNIDHDAFQFSSGAIALQVAAAIAAPLLAALWPVRQGAAITVREAIATYGLGTDFGAGRVDRAVERVGARLLPVTYATALGNMFRRKGRLALTVLVLTAAGVMFLIVMSLITSIQLTLDNDTARRGYDVRIGFTRDQPAPRILELARGVSGVEAVEVWYSRNATLLREGERLQDSAGLGAQLLGIPIGTDMYRPVIAAGRWLQEGDERAVVISQETAAQNGIRVGDTIGLDLGELGEARWQVVGTYRVVYGGGFLVEPIYAPLDAVLAAAGQAEVGTQALIRTTVKTLEAARHSADDLKAAFEADGRKVDFYTTSVKLEERQFADNQFSTIIGMLLGLAMLMASVGGIGLAGSLGISVVERTREIGVLRAVGAQSRTILGMFIAEGVFQGMLSWLVAVPISFVLARPLARTLGQTMIELNLDYAFNFPAVGMWLLVMLVLSVAASLAPGRNATRVSVRQALSYS